MFATLRAYYGPSADAIVALHARYGATHLWIRRGSVRDGVRWRRRKLPYGPFVRRLATAAEPASLHLPAACLRWKHGAHEVYDIPCIGVRRQRAPVAEPPPLPRRRPAAAARSSAGGR
jgi:hypothetical protein